MGLREAGGERRGEDSPSICTVAKLLKEDDVPEAMLNVRRLGVSGCEEKRKKPLCRRRTPSCTSPLKQFAPTAIQLRRGRSVYDASIKCVPRSVRCCPCGKALAPSWTVSRAEALPMKSEVALG